MRNMNWPGSLFAFVGAIFVTVGCWAAWDDVQFGQRAISGQAHVIDMEMHRNGDNRRMYTPVLSYTDTNGYAHSFTGSFSASSPPYDIGDRVDILYDPFDPETAKIDSFAGRYLFPLIFTGLGALALGVGLFMIWAVAKRDDELAELHDEGIRLQSEVVEIERDRRVRINRRHPWRVFARGDHPRTGERTVFRSDMLMREPDHIVLGDIVPVLVSPTKPDLYFVDTDNASRPAVGSASTPMATPGGGFGRRTKPFGRGTPAST